MTQKQFEKAIRKILYTTYTEFEQAVTIEEKIEALQKQNELLHAMNTKVGPEFLAEYNRRHERRQANA